MKMQEKQQQWGEMEGQGGRESTQGATEETAC